MAIKKHFGGGSLRIAMANEIKKVLAETGSDFSGRERAAGLLGVSAKSLENWILKAPPVGWPELQDFKGSAEKVLGTKPKGKKKRPKKKSASQTN